MRLKKVLARRSGRLAHVLSQAQLLDRVVSKPFGISPRGSGSDSLIKDIEAAMVKAVDLRRSFETLDPESQMDTAIATATALYSIATAGSQESQFDQLVKSLVRTFKSGSTQDSKQLTKLNKQLLILEKVSGDASKVNHLIGKFVKTIKELDVVNHYASLDMLCSKLCMLSQSREGVSAVSELKISLVKSIKTKVFNKSKVIKLFVLSRRSGNYEAVDTLIGELKDAYVSMPAMTVKGRARAADLCKKLVTCSRYKDRIVSNLLGDQRFTLVADLGASLLKELGRPDEYSEDKVVKYKLLVAEDPSLCFVSDLEKVLIRRYSEIVVDPEHSSEEERDVAKALYEHTGYNCGYDFSSPAT